MKTSVRTSPKMMTQVGFCALAFCLAQSDLGSANAQDQAAPVTTTTTTTTKTIEPVKKVLKKKKKTVKSTPVEMMAPAPALPPPPAPPGEIEKPRPPPVAPMREPAPTKSSKNDGIEWFNFRLGGIAAFNNATNVSPFISYDPVLIKMDDFSIGLGAQAMQYQRLSAGNVPYQTYIVGEYTLNLAYEMGDLMPEVIAGVENYGPDNGNTNPIAGLNIHYLMKEAPLLGFIDRFFVGYASLFIPGNFTSVARLGLGVSF